MAVAHVHRELHTLGHTEPHPLVTVTRPGGRVDRYLGEPPDAEGRVPLFDRTRELPVDDVVGSHDLSWAVEHARAWFRGDRIVVGDRDPVVPRWVLEEHLEAPPRTRWRRDVRDLPPHLAHRYLVLYSRCDDAIVRAIGHTLRRLKDVDGWHALGVARLEDYARERLGCTRRWAQQLMRLDRALADHAPLREAFELGTLSTAKVLALAPLADAVRDGTQGLEIPETALTRWIAKGRTASVAKLRWALPLERCDAEDRADEAAEEPADARGESPALPTADATATPPRPGASTTPPDGAPSSPDGEWVQLDVPAHVAYLHELALDTVRAMSPECGRAGDGVERVLAEYAATHGISRDDALRHVHLRHRATPDARTPDADAHDAHDNTGWRIPRDAILEPFEDLRATPPAEVPETVALVIELLGTHVPPRPEDLDAHLVRLVDLRQRRNAEMQHLLHYVHRHRLWETLGYRGFPSYCERALGLAKRTAQEMVALEESLHDRPSLRNAFRTGALSTAHVTCLVTVATEETESLWIDRARRVTVRYLAREVEEARHRATATGEPPLPLPLSTLPPFAPGSPVHPGAALEAVLLGEGGAPGEGEGGAPGEGARTCSHEAHEPHGPHESHGAHDHHRWRIRFWLPRETHQLWRAVHRDLERCHPTAAHPWQRYAILLAAALAEWRTQSDEARKRTRAYRFLEREGFMCAAPGCTERLRVEGHHVHFRSRGGSDAPENHVALCARHHRLGVHGPWRFAVHGTAPESLTWTTGIGTFTGDVRVVS